MAHARVGGGIGVGDPGPEPHVRVRSWRGGYDREEPLGLPDPALPELREGAAPFPIAEVYADLRACGMPQVGLAWRHAATLPGVLEWLWNQVRPALVGGAAAGARDRLVAVLDTAIPRLPTPDAEARRQAGLTPADEGSAAMLADACACADLVDLVLLTAVKLRWNGVPCMTPRSTAPSGPPSYVLPPPPRLSDLPVPSARIVRSLAEALGPNADDAVPDLYLHLARWPGLLAALPGWMAPLLERVALAEARDAVIGAVQAEALALVLALGPASSAPEASKAALHNALFVFPQRVIPGVLPVSIALRRLLREVAEIG